MFFHHEPKRTKPPELDPVCKTCDLYEEDTREMSFIRKLLFGNPLMNFPIRRCKHHPHFCDISDPVKCPYSGYFGGETVVMRYCDICKKDIGPLSLSPSEIADELEKDRDSFGKIIDVCPECKSKGF